MGSGSALGACRPLIVDEIFARMRNEELGMKVAVSLLYINSLPLEGKVAKGRIGHRRQERQMRKAERCAAHVGET